MQVIHASNIRNCATCGRWAGPRQADISGSKALTPFNAIGLCAGGIFNQQMVNSITLCTQYVKWLALR